MDHIIMKYHLIHKNLPKIDINDTNEVGITLEQFYELENNSIEYIDIHNILEYLDIKKFLPILNDKLRLKGKAIIIGGDIDKICEFYLDKYISYDEFANMVFDKKLYPLNYMVEYLQEYFSIDTIKTDKVLYYIECKRKINDQN